MSQQVAEHSKPGTPDAPSSEAGDTVSAEKGSRKSTWITALLVIGLVGWMGSGFILPTAEEPVSRPARLDDREAKLVAVETTLSSASTVTQFFVTEGQALPERLTRIRAEAPGRVEALEARKGQFVTEGDVVARLGAEDRSARRDRAEAELARRQRDFDAMSKLSKQGFATSARLEEARAELAAAKADVAAVAESFDDTLVRAPFSGVLDALDIEVGEFVAGGSEVGTLVDVDPLIVEIQVPQHSVSKVRAGQSAEITFITGEVRTGTIRYVASNAKATTRTFTAEVEVANPDRAIPAGISARARIPTGETAAHFVSPAVLSLGNDGTLGIKTVDEEDRVRFFPVELVRAETKGIWISGLPQTTRIISVGQGFVSDGEAVKPVKAETSPEPAPAALTSGPDASADRNVAEAIGAVPADPSPEQAIIAPVATGDVEASPVTSAVVRLVQVNLDKLGYDVGSVDGQMGTKTREAARAFQSASELDPTGEITPEFMDALASAVRRQG